MAAVVVGILILVMVFVIAALVMLVLFNLSMQKAMKAVSEKNRKINPGLIWLNLIPIPILNPIWTGYFCIATCQSMDQDAGRKIAPLQIAIVYLVLSVLQAVVSLFTTDYSKIFKALDTGQYETIEQSSGSIGTSLLGMLSFVLFIIDKDGP